jgi:Na+(H+)/acetate symporter ActP
MHKLAGCSQHHGYVAIEEETCQEIVCEERLKCYGYKTSCCKGFIFHLFAILFAGIPYILLRWYCQYVAYAKYSRCSLEEAQILLIQVIYLILYFYTFKM